MNYNEWKREQDRLMVYEELTGIAVAHDEDYGDRQTVERDMGIADVEDLVDRIDYIPELD